MSSGSSFLKLRKVYRTSTNRIENDWLANFERLQSNKYIFFKEEKWIESI